MQSTRISWTDMTWNPVRGCTRVSEGCRHCYAEQLAARFSQPGQWGHGFAEMKNGEGRWTGEMRLIREKLTEPLRRKKPALIFVNSTSDLFHEALPFEAILEVLTVISCANWHRFQVLTKRPGQARLFCEWLSSLPSSPYDHHAQALIELGGAPDLPPNLHLGVSCENQVTADDRIPQLLLLPAARRFLSLEPLLGPINLRELAPREDWHVDALDCPDRSRTIDYVLIGGESGRSARPCNLTWVRDLVRQCEEAGVPCQVKQLGSRPYEELPAFEQQTVNEALADIGSIDAIRRRQVPGFTRITSKDGVVYRRNLRLRSGHGADPAEWPEDLQPYAAPATNSGGDHWNRNLDPGWNGAGVS